MEEIAHDVRLWFAVAGLFITAWLLRKRPVNADD
jgi:hypothetical protein